MLKKVIPRSKMLSQENLNALGLILVDFEPVHNANRMEMIVDVHQSTRKELPLPKQYDESIASTSYLCSYISFGCKRV